MKRFLVAVRDLSRTLNLLAGTALLFMMALTVGDVVLRYFRHPIPGTYELVALCGAVVIGFSLPFTSWERGHIYVDFFLEKLPPLARRAVQTITRLMGMALFLLIGWNLILMGSDLRRSGEVSLTLQLPFYPVAYGIGVCCLVQCLVLLGDIIKVWSGHHE
jgi:TRAP-type C4-dicarboxylate transport system permease small subunit